MTGYITRTQTIEMAVRASYLIPGNIVEFGVAKGDSTRAIIKMVRRVEKDPRRRLQRAQKRVPRKKVFACDSFEGMPEKYENLQVGYFAGKPPRIRGVEIVKGYFDKTLTPELARRVGRVALASLDADLFSSTLFALGWLYPLARETAPY